VSQWFSVLLWPSKHETKPKLSNNQVLLQRGEQRTLSHAAYSLSTLIPFIALKLCRNLSRFVICLVCACPFTKSRALIFTHCLPLMELLRYVWFNVVLHSYHPTSHNLTLTTHKKHKRVIRPVSCPFLSSLHSLIFWWSTMSTNPWCNRLVRIVITILLALVCSQHRRHKLCCAQLVVSYTFAIIRHHPYNDTQQTCKRIR